MRTIVDKHAGIDRTTHKHRGRIDITGRLAVWKRQPRRTQKVVEDGAALIKEAKGLGR